MVNMESNIRCNGFCFDAAMQNTLQYISIHDMNAWGANRHRSIVHLYGTKQETHLKWWWDVVKLLHKYIQKEIYANDLETAEGLKRSGAMWRDTWPCV